MEEKKQEDVSPWQLSDREKAIESEDLNVHNHESPEHSKSQNNMEAMELENIQLIAKLAKTEKELQELRAS